MSRIISVCKILFWFTFFAVLTACGKKDRADGKASPPVVTQFGTTIPDNLFDIDLNKKLVFKTSKLQQDQIVDTHDYLGLSNAFFALAQQETSGHRRAAYEALGQGMREKVFKAEGAQYSISADDNPYSTAAYTYTKEQILEMSKKSAKDGVAIVSQVAKSLPIIVPADQKDPIQILDSLIGYLEKLVPEIQKQEIKDQMKSSIGSTIQGVHLKNLVALKKGILALQKGNQSSVRVFSGIKELLKALPDDYLSVDAKKETDVLLARYISVAQQVEKASFWNPGPLLSGVVTLYDDPLVNKEMFPKSLQVPLNVIGLEGRKKIAVDHSLQSKGITDVLRVQQVNLLSNALRVYNVSDAKKLIFEKMNQVAFQMISDKLSPFLTSLPEKVTSKVSEQTQTSLVDLEKNQDKIYFDTAKQILKAKVFGDQATYGVLEKGQLRVVVKADNKTTFEPDSGKLGKLVSARAVAEGIHSEINQAQVLEKNATTGELPQNKGIVISLFALISRLLIVGGYDDVNGVWSPSLHIQAGGPGFQNYLTIKEYVPEQALFATPDYIPVQNNFRLDRAEVQKPDFSVASQMGLLSAYSHSMRFLRSWTPNVFDRSIAKLDYEGIEVFPKKSFYKLSVGLAAVVLKNLSLKNLLVIDRYDKVHRAGEEDLALLSNRQSALVIDFDEKGQKENVTASDIAAQIHGVVDFLEAAADFEKTEDPALVSNIPAIQAARPKLELLIMGMANFASTRLQRKTGEFAAQFSIRDMAASSSTANLTDQLKLTRALHRAGAYLKAPIFQWAALDCYFSLKQNWIDTRIGFFKDSQGQVDIHSVLEFLSLAKEIADSEFLSPKSRDHLKVFEQLVVEKILMDGFAAMPQSVGLVTLSP